MSYDFTELSELININSYTKNKRGVDKNGEIFSQKMLELGFELQKFKESHIGDHLLFKSPKKEGEKILLVGHLDTVFAPNTFEKFHEDDEWIYGPGVCDMKGGNFVALESLRNVKKELHDIYNIDMFLVSDEETGSDDSKAITENLAKEYDYALVFEAAGENDEVVIGRKGVATLYVDIKGHAAHAGNCYLDGVDANLEAARMIIALSHLTNLSLGTTVNVGKIEGGIGANTISAYAKLTLEFRYSNSSQRDKVMQEIYDIVHNTTTKGIKTKLSGGIQRDVFEPDQKQADFIKRIENIIGKKLKTEKRGGVSDANILANAGVTTLDGFGPFGDGDHTIHERASKKSFLNRVDMVTKILKEFVRN